MRKGNWRRLDTKTGIEPPPPPRVMDTHHRPRTWEGCNECKRQAWSPRGEEHAQERPESERAQRKRADCQRRLDKPEVDDEALLAMFQHFEKFRKTQQGGGDNKTRCQLDFD